MTAGLASLFLGCVLVILIDRVLNKVSSPEQVEADLGLDLLGVIPKMQINIKKPEKKLFTNNPEQFGFSESFRTLRSVIVQLRARRPLQVIQITSPQPNDGKSFVSLNLALALVQGGGSVLLVGADMRRPGLHRAFGLSNDSGLAEVLQDLKDWKSQVLNTGYDKLDLMPSGQACADPPRLLQSPIMSSLISDWRNNYDWVVLDCPPLVAVSDAIVVAPLCDATILVLRADCTPTRLAQVAINILHKRAHYPVGAILNAIDLRRGYYPSYGYYRYQYTRYSYDREAAKTPTRNARSKTNQRRSSTPGESLANKNGKNDFQM